MFKNKMVLGLVLVVSLGLGSAGATVSKKPAMSERQVASSERKGTELGHREKIQAGVKTKVTEQKETQTVAEVQAIEPKFAMEYKFDESVIDVIFGEATMTVKEARALGVKGIENRKDNEKVKIKYPKVVVTKAPWSTSHVTFPKSIKFFNNKGKLIKEFPLEKGIVGVKLEDTLTISKNNKYICVLKTRVRGEEEGESIMLDTDGNVLWKAKHRLISAYPSPCGTYIVGEPDPEWSLAIFVYYKDGSFKKIKKDTDIWDVDFFDNGDFFAVSTEKVDREKRKKGLYAYTVYLAVFDKNCNELWRKEVGKGIPIVVVTSDDLIHLLTSSWRDQVKFKKYIFDKNGNLLKIITENAKEAYVKALYKKLGQKFHGISDDFYKKLQYEKITQ